MLEGMLHDKRKSKLKIKKGAGRCTYMVKPPDVFPNYRIRELWKGSQAGAPKWWSRQWRVCSRRGLGCTFVARASGCTYMAEPLPCAMV